MKIMTKEWVKDFELVNLLSMLKTNTDKKIPFVFTNGGTEGVAEKDLHRANGISFLVLPDTFDLGIDFLGDGENITDETYVNDFLIQYLNRLRIIDYLPE